MKARDLQHYFHSLRGAWDYPSPTVDTFKSGDPDTEVQGIAVGWMSYTWALREAVRLGCNVFVTHEPTYFNHWDTEERFFRFAGVTEKRQYIEAQRLVIIRCHDLWDQLPQAGIPDSWGAFLGFEAPVARSTFLRAYAVAGRTAQDIARQVAERTRPLGQQAVQLIGEPTQPVSRVAIGTGAITPYFEAIEQLQADMMICTDDGMFYWQEGAFAVDIGIPLVVVNHPVSEEAGVISLAQRIRQQFPDVPVHHIPQRCMYRLIEANDSV
jgi:putative NIF3 family GTP cyclohydrolase 1 type 2